MTFTADLHLSREHAEQAAVAGFVSGGAAVIGGLPALLLALFPWVAVVGFYAATILAAALVFALDEAGR